MRTQPPFSSGGGLFAFSMVAIKESKILAIKNQLKFKAVKGSNCFTYKRSHHVLQKFRQKDNSIAALVLIPLVSTLVAEYLNQTCYQR
jgi:hypothetical protein